MSSPVVPAGRTEGDFREESTPTLWEVGSFVRGAEKQVEMDPQDLLMSGLPALPVTPASPCFSGVASIPVAVKMIVLRISKAFLAIWIINQG